MKLQDTTVVKYTDGIYVKKDISIDQITITPLNCNDSIVVDGKVYKNAILTIKKVKDNSLYSKSKTIDINTSKTQTSEVKRVEETKVKRVVKKTDILSYSWLYILLAILMFIAYKYLRNINILKVFN